MCIQGAVNTVLCVQAMTLVAGCVAVNESKRQAGQRRDLMQKRTRLFFLSGLCIAVFAGPAAAGCGLNVNPGALDTNRSTTLSRAEAYGSPLAPVFDRIDTDKNGFISQPEYANRCASLQASANNNGWNDSPVGERVQRQQKRQQNRINNRINRESNEAADGMVDKAMNAIFGN